MSETPVRPLTVGSGWCWFDMFLFLQVGDMDSDQIVVAALGRPFALGMLYDARNDKLNTGKTYCHYSE